MARSHFKKRHKYTNLLLIGLGVLMAFYVARLPHLHDLLSVSDSLSIIGILIAGFLFVVSFTAPTGAVLLLLFAEKYNAIEIGLIAAAGSVLADLIIFRFVKDTLVEEVTPIYKQFGGNHLTHLLHTKYFSWTLPVIGAAIIASPLPDEVGVTLMGFSKMSTAKFLIISFVLNAIGISLIVASSAVIRP